MALLLLATILAGVAASGVGVDNAVHIWFVDDDPALLAYQDFQEEFGNDEVVVIGVEGASGQALDAAGWRRLRHSPMASRRRRDGSASFPPFVRTGAAAAGIKSSHRA